MSHRIGDLATRGRARGRARCARTTSRRRRPSRRPRSPRDRPTSPRHVAIIAKPAVVKRSPDGRSHRVRAPRQPDVLEDARRAGLRPGLGPRRRRASLRRHRRELHGLSRRLRRDEPRAQPSGSDPRAHRGARRGTRARLPHRPDAARSEARRTTRAPRRRTVRGRAVLVDGSRGGRGRDQARARRDAPRRHRVLPWRVPRTVARHALDQGAPRLRAPFQPLSPRRPRCGSAT